ncbi:MAG: hypothetical protein V4441_04455 [Pseudomonadota bacterium]
MGTTLFCAAAREILVRGFPLTPTHRTIDEPTNDLDMETVNLLQEMSDVSS